MKSLKLKAIVTLLVTVFVLSNNVFAQDKIYKKYEHKPIEAKVIEITETEVRYKNYANRSADLVYILTKETIEKIEFENGTVEKFGLKTIDEIDLEEYFEGQKRNAIKGNFIGNFWGTTKISYEHVLKPARSIETKMTLITGDDSGFIGSFGYKIYRKPSFIAPNMRRRNIMEGTYIKPELFVGSVDQSGIFESRSRKEKVAGAVLNIGKQWIIGEVFAIDTYIGTGVGTGSTYRGYLMGEGLVMTAGLNFGFTF